MSPLLRNLPPRKPFPSDALMDAIREDMRVAAERCIAGARRRAADKNARERALKGAGVPDNDWLGSR